MRSRGRTGAPGGSEDAGDSAEATALTELGDPAKLAASLTDGPQYLIGPGLYWDYRRVLRALLMIVPGVVTLTVSTVQAFTGTPTAGGAARRGLAVRAGRRAGGLLDHPRVRHSRAHRHPRDPRPSGLDGRRPPETARPTGHPRRDRGHRPGSAGRHRGPDLAALRRPGVGLRGGHPTAQPRPVDLLAAGPPRAHVRRSGGRSCWPTPGADGRRPWPVCGSPGTWCSGWSASSCS